MRPEALSIFNGADAVSFSPSSGSCGSRLAAGTGTDRIGSRKYFAGLVAKEISFRHYSYGVF
jgi:hypothetical protein